MRTIDPSADKEAASVADAERAQSAPLRQEGAASPKTRNCAAREPVSEAAVDEIKEAIEDDETVLRIERLPRDVAWLMIYVGILGVILPGIIGTPFLIAGLAILAPGGPKLLARWAARNRRGFVHASLKQINRWLEDLDRRYPRLPSA